MATLGDIEAGLADLARIMRTLGPEGMRLLPIFDRLEREREKLLDIDARLDRAMARLSPREHRLHRVSSAGQRTTST